MSDAGAFRGSSSGPSATSVHRKSKYSRKCICFWPDCEDLHLEAQETLPSDHPWCQPILQIQSHGESSKKLALRESIAHHLHLSDKDREKRTYYVHRHHFSLIGWNYSSTKTKCIDANTAKAWDAELGRMAYYDSINSLEYIIEKRLREKMTAEEKGLFVEAPIVTKSEVCAVLDSHSKLPSDRTNRMMIRATSTVKPPSTAPKKKKQKLVAVTT
jgi:hypothetical protein